MEDITSSQCKRVLVQLSTYAGLRLSGDSGPLGSIIIAIHPHCDGVMSVECNREASTMANTEDSHHITDDKDNMST